MLSTKNYIINIGIDDYQNLDKLNGNQEILTKISNLLIEKYEFEQLNLINLFNEKATRAAFYNTINSLKNRELENLIVFYSGHGEFEYEISGYLQMYEAEVEKKSTWLPHSEFLDSFKPINAKSIFIGVKACNSGYLFKKIQNSNAISENIGEGKARLLFTSSSGNDLTPETSPFWEFLYESLKSNGGKRTAIESIVTQVKTRMVEEYDDKLTPRSGTMDNDEGGMMYLLLKENEETIWEQTQNTDTIEEYSTYLKFFSKYKKEASTRIEQLRKEKELWEGFLKESIEKMEKIRPFSTKYNNFLEEKYNSFTKFYENLTETDRFEIELNILNTDKIEKLLSYNYYALEIELNELNSIIDRITFFIQKHSNQKIQTLKTNLEKIQAIKNEKELWQEVQAKKRGAKSYEILRNAYTYYIVKTSVRAYEKEAKTHISAFELLIEITRTTSEQAKTEKYHTFFLKYNAENFDYFNKIEKEFESFKSKIKEKEENNAKNNQIISKFENLSITEDLDAIIKLTNQVEDTEIKQKIQDYIDEKFIDLETDFQDAKIENTLQSLFLFIEKYKEKTYAKSIVSKAFNLLRKKEENEFNNIENREVCLAFIEKWAKFDNGFIAKAYEKLDSFAEFIDIVKGKIHEVIENPISNETEQKGGLPTTNFSFGVEDEKNVLTEDSEKDRIILTLREELENFKKKNRTKKSFWEEIEDNVFSSFFKTALLIIVFAITCYFIVSIFQ